MALLRRPDDHRRELRARWPNSRSAVASGRGQNRNAMTLCHDVRYRLTPPSSAPEPHFRRCFAVASVPAKAPAASSTRPKSPNQPRRQRQTRYRDRRSRRRRPRTHLQPKPPPRQIPIDGNRPPGGPRVPSWGAFGRRPCTASTARARAGIRNPSPERTSGATPSKQGRSGMCAPRSGAVMCPAYVARP